MWHLHSFVPDWRYRANLSCRPGGPSFTSTDRLTFEFESVVCGLGPTIFTDSLPTEELLVRQRMPRAQGEVSLVYPGQSPPRVQAQAGHLFDRLHDRRCAEGKRTGPALHY